MAEYQKYSSICDELPKTRNSFKSNNMRKMAGREDQATAEQLKHMTLATARLRFLFLAAKSRVSAMIQWYRRGFLSSRNGLWANHRTGRLRHS
jgi:hypothetical protein